MIQEFAIIVVFFKNPSILVQLFLHSQQRLMARPFKLMPGPRGIPLLGSVLDYTSSGKYSFDRLHLAKYQHYKEFGKIYKEKLGPGVTLVQVFDPEDAGRVFRADGKFPHRPPIPITIAANKRDGFALGLGSLNSEAWYDHRRAVQRLMMHPKAATVYLPVQDRVADDFLKKLEGSRNSDGEIADFQEILLKYTMESIGAVCFNDRMGCLDDIVEENSLGEKMLISSNLMFASVQKTTFAFPWYFVFRTKLYKQFVENKKICNSIAHEHLKKVKEIFKAGSRSTDPNGCPYFMSSLVSAKTSLSEEQVVGLVTDLFTAGIDSTANALSFIIYNLAKNPEKQEKLFQEITQELPTGASVTGGNLDKLSYLKACVKESFRLNFPIEGGTTRILQSETELGNYVVPKGTIVALNNQTMCLQEEHFPNPEMFLPERWLKDGSSSMKPAPPFVMLPFGYGPRMCIGRRFAEQEIYLALIKILQKFKVEYHHEEIGMINRVFTMPDKPLKVKIIPRSH